MDLDPSTLNRAHPLRDQIYHQIRNLIVVGQMKAGEVINEVAIAEALGVSRTAYREAMRILTRRYALFFLFLAGLNEFVWRTQSDTTWGWFKASIIVIILVFALTQTPLMLKYAKLDEAQAKPPE